MTTTTWVGATDTNWGATPGGVSLNWDTGLVPTSADAVVINGTSPDDVILNGNASCASFNSTGFADAFALGAFNLTVAGNMTFEAESGGLQGDGGNVITVGGNLILNAAVGLLNTAMYWDVTGTAVAHDIDIAYQDFSAGTDLDATDDCLDSAPGSNTGVVFGSLVWDGSASNITATAANWTPAEVPHASRDVEVGTAPDDVTGNIVCKSVDFTGFAGEFDGNIIASGSVTLASGMTLGASNEITFADDGTLDAAGLAAQILYVQDDASVAIQLADDLSVHGLILTNAGSSLDFNDNIITFDLADQEDGFYCAESATISFDAGAKIIGLVDAGGYLDVGTGSTDATFTPPVEVSGGGQFYNDGTYCKMQSLLVTGGGAYWNTQSHDIGYSYVETVGNLTIAGGVLTSNSNGTDSGNQTLIVGGNLDISDVDVIDYLIMDVTGTAALHDAAVSHCTNLGLVAIDCTDGCTDGGGNVGLFNFPALNEAPVADAGEDDTIGFPGPYTLDGSATDADMDDLTYLWTKVSGPGAVTFEDDTDPVTDVSVDEEGVYVLRLTADDGTDSDSDDMTLTFSNAGPVANAGNDSTIKLPATATLDGTGSTDDGAPIDPGSISYLWEYVSGPLTFEIASEESALTLVSFGAPGSYVFRLTVDDGEEQDTDEVTINVTADFVGEGDGQGFDHTPKHGNSHSKFFKTRGRK